jgi:hypothetical protein
MTVDSLIQTCEALGIKLALKGGDSDRLVVDAPKGALTPSLRDELTARKPQLIAFLKQRNQSASQTQASTSQTSEVTEGRAPASQKKVPEARSLIQEQTLSISSTQFERAEGEVKKLLAGRDYDVNVIDAQDSATRQIIDAQLLNALASGNRDTRDAARRAFMGHGYFDDATRQLRTADSPAERAAAARKLGVARTSSATANLIAALYDSAPEVRRAAVEALAQAGDAAAISPLHELLARENSRQIPEAVIHQAINAISVTQAQSMSRPEPPVVDVPKKPVASFVPEKPVSTFVPPQPKREISSEYLNSFEPSPVTSFAPPVSAPPSRDAFAVTEERLRVEEEALRRAAGELERKRIEAEAARRQAEEEARLKAEREAQARMEIEARIRAEEEIKRRAAEESARKKAEEEARVLAEREARNRAEEEARQRAEEEARFRLEAETLRKAAEEIARQRAEAEVARKLAEEEARRRAEEEAKRRA